MDTIGVVSGLLAAQASNLQLQITARLIKSNADAEKAAVLTLLGAPPPANVAPGLGGRLDVRA